MKKKIHVKHQHRYTFEEADLYIGEATFNVFDEYEELVYKEEDGVITRVSICDDYIRIQRDGEIQSNLAFRALETTSNLMKSEYGNFEVEIYTHHYKKRANYVEVEYDIVASETKEGFKIVFEIMEDASEFN